MTELLKQFILESRDFLQNISANLISLEKEPDNSMLITELFRSVHTLKGNSGLFDFPDMTKVLHEGEDLMVLVRDGEIPYSVEIADHLFSVMDFVSIMLDEIEENENPLDHKDEANQLIQNLRDMKGGMNSNPVNADLPDSDKPYEGKTPLSTENTIPEAVLMDAFKRIVSGETVFLINFKPEEECFYKGEDPFYQIRNTPGELWGAVNQVDSWPPIDDFDCYRCIISFVALSSAPKDELLEYFRYIPDQVRIVDLEPLSMIIPEGEPNGGPVYDDFVADAVEFLESNDLQGLERACNILLELTASNLWVSSALRWMLVLITTIPARKDVIRRLAESLHTLTIPDYSDLFSEITEHGKEKEEEEEKEEIHIDPEQYRKIMAAQMEVLSFSDDVGWFKGRLKACAATVAACLSDSEDIVGLEEAVSLALDEKKSLPLRDWLKKNIEIGDHIVDTGNNKEVKREAPLLQTDKAEKSKPVRKTDDVKKKVNYGRRMEDQISNRILKVDQHKVDRLMDLIGEMVVSKNALPYLASKAEVQYGLRELSRELKLQFAVINRIVEDMQDSMMNIRMVPVSVIFQRFPRLVRDISRKLGKEVKLVLEGEDTEAEKTIIEALSDPLIHIVRNSLDHGIELPDVRIQAGKPSYGTIAMIARQDSDRVVIEVSDDGHGIDPEIIKQKAYDKGLIDEERLERINNDQEAVNLIFLSGFSTVDTVSEISGRGVGMDVVRNAVEKVGGTISLENKEGMGMKIILSLPLSMAVINVMIVEINGRIFGVQMDQVVETVRIPADRINLIKDRKTTVLRDRLIPLYTLMELLSIDSSPVMNEDNEFAVLVVRVGNEYVGLIVDAFREVVDIILKPMPGELKHLSGYAGTALLGDGSVLMVINPKELF